MTGVEAAATLVAMLDDVPLVQRVADLESDVLQLQHKQRSDPGSLAAALDQTHADLADFRAEMTTFRDEMTTFRRGVGARFNRVETTLGEHGALLRAIAAHLNIEPPPSAD